MSVAEDLHYSEDHAWVSEVTGQATLGVTAYAVEQLGDIVNLDLPALGSEFQEGDPFGTIESTKTVSDLYMPGHVRVVAINAKAVAEPGLVQESPYEQGWLLKVEFVATPSKLLSASDYEAFTHED